MSKLMNLAEVTTAQLVAAHNAAAEMLGQAAVKKFQDRATAERRTRMMVSQITTLSKRPFPFNEGGTEGEQHFRERAGEERVNGDEAHAQKMDEAADRHAEVPDDDKKQKDGDEVTNTTELNFGQRPGSKREALIKKLTAKRNDYVGLDKLIKAVYGADADVDEQKGPIMMVMKGMNVMIEKNNLPVKILKRKEGKNISYGLFDNA